MNSLNNNYLNNVLSVIFIYTIINIIIIEKINVIEAGYQNTVINYNNKNNNSPLLSPFKINEFNKKINNITCKIPNESELGECIPIKLCKAYRNLQRIKEYLTPENINFMKRVQCSNSNEAFNINFKNFNSNKVCCPKRIKFKRSITKISDDSTTIDNNDHHSDLYLDPTINFTKPVVKPRILVGDQGGGGGGAEESSAEIRNDNSRIMKKTVKRLIPKIIDDIHSRSNDRLLTGSVFEDCGRQIANRVYGGEIAELDEYPWLALIFYNSDEFGCSGSLISYNFVLTAAHCVTGAIVRKKNGLKLIRLGEFNVKTQPDCIQEENYLNCADAAVDVEIDKFFVHPRYDEESPLKSDDIALIRLKSNVSFSHFIMPICLPKLSNQILENPFEEGKYFSVAGWGRTDLFNSYFPNIRSPIKLKLRVPYVPNQNCSDILKEHGANLDNRQICAGGELSKDTCAGDSGGPLMFFDQNILRWIAYGIVSFGFSECGLAGHPAVYTNVTGYVEWITTVMRNNA